MDYNIESTLPQPLVGIDEAGRGCLAGPVVVAGVMGLHNLPRLYYTQLNDSKKIPDFKRRILAQQIKQYCPFFMTQIEADIIDKINILQATLTAMQAVYNHFNPRFFPALVMIDGNKIPENCPLAQYYIGGDAIYPSIAAASILAKTTRDDIMIEYDQTYPEYGFAKHKGYGTAQHRTAIQTHGPTPIHRTTFIKRIQNIH